MAKNAWTGRNDDPSHLPTKERGWGSSLWGTGHYYNSASNLGDWFRRYATQAGLDESTAAYLSSLDDATLGGLIDEFWQKNVDGILWNHTDRFDAESALQNLKALSSMQLPEPSKSYEDIYNEMSAKIDEENAAASSLYDQALANQKSLYNSQMSMLENGYNRYAKQALAMDYQKNNQLMANLGNNLNKSRQNALEAGASAGIRLANNVNTLMSTQNAAAQQSLQTSNNLAQMLMNQQNAAAGLKSNLANAYSNNLNQKADLVKGDFERKKANADSSWDISQKIYDDKVARATSGLEGNAFKDSYLKFKQGQTGSTSSQQSSGSSPY